MNVQVEHIENHIAQMKVQVASSEVQSARQRAAKKLAKRLRIPGFRPGKAPYNVVVRTIGDEAILEEAVEGLAQDTYRFALEESKIDPVAQGQLIDFSEDESGELTLNFHIPKQPEVTLPDYRAIRKEFSIEDVGEAEVDKIVDSVREEHAVLEDVERASELGDSLSADLKITFWHNEAHDHDHDHDDEDDASGEAEAEEAEVAETESAEEDEAEEHDHGHWHTLVDEKETSVILHSDADKDIFPGFSAELVGLSAGESKEFKLTVPEDFDDEMLAGNEVNIVINVHLVRNRTLPALDDELAKLATHTRLESLVALREDIRKDLEEAAKRKAESDLFNDVIDELVEQTELKYPEVLIEIYTDGLLRNMDRMFQQQMGLTMDDYLRISGQTVAQVRAEQRPNAISRLKRELVYGELVEAEGLQVDEAAIEREVTRRVASFGEQAEIYRRLLDTPQNREDIANNLISSRVIKRIVDIVTGQEPAVGPDPEPEVEEVADQPEARIVIQDAGESVSVADKPADADQTAE